MGVVFETSHIAVVISGLSGRMHSGFELLSRLEMEGHQVTCLCQPYTTEVVAKQGFDYLEIPQINFKYSDPKANVEKTSWFQKWMRHLNNRRSRYEQGKKWLQLGEYEKIWTELKPDHVLVDVELHDLIFTAYAARIPVTLFHTWFSDTPSIGLPPIRSSITPGKGFGGSTLGIAWARIIDRAKIRGRLYFNKLRFQEYRRATLKKYAQEIGFPVADLSLSTLPPLYRFKKLPILLLALSELDFPHRPAKNISYVGPMVYKDRDDGIDDTDTAQRLNEIFIYKEECHKKLIYCSVSSFVTGDVTFLKRVVAAVRDETDWLMVLSTGGNLPQEKLGVFPKNVHIFDWVPQLQVLEKADCSINHAGINSINECLHFSVPILAYSGKMFDQNGNAARIHYHGLGLRGDKDKDDVAVIRKNIRTVLTDPKYQNTISEFNGLYEDYCQRELSTLIFRE